MLTYLQFGKLEAAVEGRNKMTFNLEKEDGLTRKIGCHQQM